MKGLVTREDLRKILKGLTFLVSLVTAVILFFLAMSTKIGAVIIGIACLIFIAIVLVGLCWKIGNWWEE